jgi:hypothetical protein
MFSCIPCGLEEVCYTSTIISGGVSGSNRSASCTGAFSPAMFHVATLHLILVIV